MDILYSEFLYIADIQRLPGIEDKYIVDCTADKPLPDFAEDMSFDTGIADIDTGMGIPLDTDRCNIAYYSTPDFRLPST